MTTGVADGSNNAMGGEGAVSSRKGKRNSRFRNKKFSVHSSRRDENRFASLAIQEEEDVMERRDFLKIALGVVAGAAAVAAAAQAAPLTPQPLGAAGRLPANQDAHPAVTNQSEVDHLQPQEVRWGYHGRGHHWGWRHRHWGWHRRHWGWRRRHWGWRRRHWRRRYW